MAISKCIPSSFIVISTCLAAGNAFGECYNYDDLGRLEGVVYSDVDSPGNGHAKLSYTLDPHGIRTQVETQTSQGQTCAAPTGAPSAGTNVANVGGQYAPTPPPNPQGPNIAPVADDEAISVVEGNFTAVLPLEGDIDADGDSLILASVISTSPLITVNTFGEAVTVRAHGTTGTAIIDYTVSDGRGGTDVGTITVTVTEDISLNNNCTTDPNAPGCE